MFATRPLFTVCLLALGLAGPGFLSSASAQPNVVRGKYFILQSDGTVGSQLGTFEVSPVHLRLFNAAGASAISVDLTQTPIDAAGTVRYGSYEGGRALGKLLGGGNITPVGIGAGGIIFRLQDMWYLAGNGQQINQAGIPMNVVIVPDP